MKPRIGITCGEIRNALESWAPFTYAQRHTYVDAIVRAGGVPVLLPITDDESVQKSLFDLCDGILFAGGNDIDPELYGQSVMHLTVDISPARDAQEKKLLHWALQENKPILCICRGMQLFNVVCGGTLYQDIETMVPEALDHRASIVAQNMSEPTHLVHITPESKLGGVLGVDSLIANSLHHQGVDTVGEGLLVTAKSDDGVVEAIELPTQPFAIGLQSHPEALELFMPEWGKLFVAFIAAATP